MAKKHSSREKLSLQHWVVPGVIVVLYLVTHLWGLLKLPVFADESIYIRWTQLIMDDWQQYLFFPLNDGKTPLFIWLMIPFQYLFDNQLMAGRIVSVLTGLAQLWVTWAVIRELGGRKKAGWLGMLFVTILPYWFFYHRMALMDSLLTFFMSLTFWGLLKLQKAEVRSQQVWAVALTGLSFGLALWTKMPALFMAPIFMFLTLLHPAQKLPQWLRLVIFTGISGVIGLGLFALLKMSPAFGQLFRRSQDFGYTFTEILQGRWRDTLPSTPTYFMYFVRYLTWPVVFLAFAGLFSNAVRRKNVILLLSTIAFCAPFALMGKVVYARYLLPAIFFVTVASVLSLQALYDRYFIRNKNLVVKLGVGLVIASLLGSIAVQSVSFIGSAVTNPDGLSLTSSDRSQYLEEWSSGHGIAEAVELIRARSKEHSVAVATEGRFGTLPDGLLMYFHGTDVKNMYIEGTGQYPVKNIPEFFRERAQQFDESLLVVNSHRMEISLPAEKKILEVCRPNKAPCLQVWDITHLVKSP